MIFLNNTMKKLFCFSFFLILSISQLDAQGLLDSLDAIVDPPKTKEFVESTFKAPRLINGQSVELIGRNELAAIISHRFGPTSEGAYNFYGLTESHVRLGLDYGILNRVNVGVGVGSFQRLWDGFLKVKLARQSHGKRSFPFTIVYSATGFYTFTKWTDPSRNNLFTSRFSYSHQLLIARKFNSRISIQITPGVVHRNLVPREIDQNNVYSVAFGGRFKLTKRLSLNTEYYYLLPGQTQKDFVNPFSVGLDIETGGHVFQLILSNAQSPQEKVFIPETTNKWSNGDIHFGFNIVRVFGLSHKKKID